MPYISVKNEI